MNTYYLIDFENVNSVGLETKKNGKQQIYRSIVSKYGQEKGLKLYRDVKKIYC